MPAFTHFRLRREALAGLVLMVLAGCSDAPLSPMGLAEPARAALSAATVERGTYDFSFDAYQYWDCVGEDIHNVINGTARYSTVTNDQGSLYRELWFSDRDAGTITGMTSGTVWRREIKASPFRTSDLGGGRTGFVYRGRFVSETGPTLFVREVFHTSSNAAGEVKVDNYEFTCDVGRNSN